MNIRINLGLLLWIAYVVIGVGYFGYAYNKMGCTIASDCSLGAGLQSVVWPISMGGSFAIDFFAK